MSRSRSRRRRRRRRGRRRRRRHRGESPLNADRSASVVTAVAQAWHKHYKEPRDVSPRLGRQEAFLTRRAHSRRLTARASTKTATKHAGASCEASVTPGAEQTKHARTTEQLKTCGAKHQLQQQLHCEAVDTKAQGMQRDAKSAIHQIAQLVIEIAEQSACERPNYQRFASRVAYKQTKFTLKHLQHCKDNRSS